MAFQALGLHGTNLNTLSTQTPRGQELLGQIEKRWQIKMRLEKMVLINGILIK